MRYTPSRRSASGAVAAHIIKTVLPAVLAALILVNVAPATGGVMLQIKDAPLKDVIMLLTQQTGANIVIADESRLTKNVTCSLNDVPLEKALDYVVKSAGVSYTRMEDGTYIIGGSETLVPLISPSDIQAELPPVEQPAPVHVAPPPAEKKVAVIKLVHSKPSELLRLLGWTLSNPMPNCEVAYPYPGTASNKRDRLGGNVYQSTPSGKVYDFGEGVPMINNQPVMPTIDPVSRPAGAGRTADSATGAGQTYVGPPTRPPGYTVPGRPGTTPTATAPGTTPAASGTTPTSTTSTSGNFLWPEGLVGDPVPFDLDNSILIKGDDDAIAQFKQMVRLLDVPPKQVEIKAEFVEISTNDAKKFGLDWSMQRLQESFETQFAPSGNVIFAFATGNLTVKGAAQLTKDIGRIINAPIISTLNNQWAEISITNEIPFWTSTTIITDAGAVNSPYVEFIYIDTGLGVLPRINGDGTVTMTLQPRVSDTGLFIQGPGDVGGAFETRTQQLFTQRRVANGETIVVGGFIRKNDSNSIQKVPILGDLPIIGSLFRTTAKTSEDRELLIFITPRIVPETTGGATIGTTLIP